MSIFSSERLVRTAVLSLLAGGVAVGAYDATVALSDGTGAGTPAAPSVAVKAKAVSFTTAGVGECVTWDVGEDGSVVNFTQTDCDNPHRFEISSRQDLGAIPSSEYGPNATPPDLTRQAQLREDLCAGPTLEYLGGKYDPAGIFSIASILPPALAWENGDRTMLCGVQVTDDRGTILLSSGKATERDQTRVAEPGQCVRIDDSDAPHLVDCGEPHSYEVTKVIDLTTVFDRFPAPEEQDAYLKETCTQADMDYLGGDDPLYYSTLSVYWTTVTADAWNAGSHSAECALFHPTPDAGFSQLVGSATGEFTIDGNPPEARPERRPLRNP
ncbi:MAG: septum formation family protein [Corynebacterium sp.]|nr:septum formation family protein [Corynebacterium sp.]